MQFFRNLVIGPSVIRDPKLTISDSLKFLKGCIHYFAEITFIFQAERTAAKAPRPAWRNPERHRRRRRRPETA